MHNKNSNFKSMWELLGDCIPDDHCEQVGSQYFLGTVEIPKGGALLDHGCGSGTLKTWLDSTWPEVRYYGLDLCSSPEVEARSNSLDTLDCFYTYDGETIPFGDNYFDLVYSNTVFEHVRYPEKAVSELHRVLKPGGGLIASLAYLYPYHSYSMFNFTPYGWHTILTENGFEVQEFRPGIDSISSIIRGYNFNHKRYDKWFNLSPFNKAIEKKGRRESQSIKQINMRKIMNTGVLHSYSIKP